MERRSSILYGLVFLIGLAAAPAGAETITFDLSGTGGALNCGSTWMDQGCLFEIHPAIEADACFGGLCGTGNWGNGLGLAAARLRVDLLALQGEVTVEIDIIEYDPSLTTRAWIWNLEQGFQLDYAESTMSGAQTLTLTTGAWEIEELAVSGCEVEVTEIRIDGDVLVPAEVRTWGAVKALY